MATSFVRRQLEITVQLAAKSNTNQPGVFNESGTSSVTLAGSRTSVRIQNSGAPVGSKAQVSIFGLTPSLMNQLSTLGMVYDIVSGNTLLIRAGDSESGMTSVFLGTVQSAYADFSSAPDVPFLFDCTAGLFGAVEPTAALSITGTADVATIMAGFARQLNLGFENNGVDVKLSNPYYSGNAWTQMRRCAEDAGIMAEPYNEKLCIWPKGKTRNTRIIPVVSKDTGMVSYPSYTQNGIILKTVFNPQISFGGLIKVETSLEIVNKVGIWGVNKLDLNLDAQVDGGDWLATIAAFNPNYPRPIPSPAGA